MKKIGLYIFLIMIYVFSYCNALGEDLSTIYYDQSIKVDFIRLIDYSEIFPESQDLGVCYIEIKAENHFGKDITVRLDDIRVNNQQVMALSGIPMDVCDGSIRQHMFYFSYGMLDMSNRSEIVSVVFKIEFRDSSYSIVLKTEDIKLEFVSGVLQAPETSQSDNHSIFGIDMTSLSTDELYELIFTAQQELSCR